MPCRRTHEEEGRVVGGLIGVIGNLAVQNHRIEIAPWTPFDLGEVVACGLVGMLVGQAGAVLPDQIEPGTSSWHRKTAHSWTALGAVTLGTLSYVTADLPGWARLVTGTFGAGYATHLLSDSETPRGLPRI